MQLWARGQKGRGKSAGYGGSAAMATCSGFIIPRGTLSFGRAVEQRQSVALPAGAASGQHREHQRPGT